MSKGNILFKLTGSIACYKACNVISKLTQEGYEVKTACTPGALQFIGLSTLESLSGKPVYFDLFERKTALEHIDLNKWADITVVCPATANIINKFAAGIGDDCVSTLFLSSDMNKPYLIFPAMNEKMLLHPATQNSIKILKKWGVKVMDTVRGHQACGDIGPGRMLEPKQILELIKKELK